MYDEAAQGHTGGATAHAHGRPHAGTGLGVRRKVGASHIVLLLGSVAMAVALVLVITGVPAEMGYSQDEAGMATPIDGAAPHEYTAIIDANVKYLRDRTGDDPGEYVGLQKSISKSEDSVAAIAEATLELESAIKELDSSMNGILAVTRGMDGTLAELEATEDSAEATMAQLATDLTAISGTMAGMTSEATVLADRFATMQREVDKIAEKDLPKAKALIAEISAGLPDEVPPPVLSGPVPE